MEDHRVTSASRPTAWFAWRPEYQATLLATAFSVVVAGAIGYYTHYVSGLFFLLTITALAWKYGWWAGLLSTLLSVAAYWPLMVAFDDRAVAVPDQIGLRLVNTTILALTISWFCENLHAARRTLVAEQLRLRESETFHRVIADLAADFAWHARVEPDGRVIIDSATSGLTMLLGYSVEDFKDGDWTFVVHADDRDMVRAAVGRAVGGERVDGFTRAV